MTTPQNSDIASLPGTGGDVQEGVDILTPSEQYTQLVEFFEDNYADIIASLREDAGRPYTDRGELVPAELKDDTERMWARVPDLLTHSSQLVLGAGLNHSMPQVAFTREGVDATAWAEYSDQQLPAGVSATVLRPTSATAGDSQSTVAIALHGGPGWFGDAESHEQLWQPLFAAIAQQSGCTIIDVTYPLPVYGSWENTRQAVSAVAEAVTRIHGSAPGIVSFGSGWLAAADVAEQAPWIAAMTPRIAPDSSLSLDSVPVHICVGKYDTRGTEATVAREFFEGAGATVAFEEWESGHMIAAPTVWRERVQGVAGWIAEQIS